MMTIHRFLLRMVITFFLASRAISAQPFPIECYLDIPGSRSLCDNTYSLTLRGGINPAWYLDTTDSYFFEQPAFGDVCPISRKLWKFSDQYKLPWTIGLEAAYLACRGIEFFADGDYTTASRERVKQSVSYLGKFKATFKTFLTAAGYLGVRLYSAPFWCDRFAAFFGIKAGMLYRRQASGQFKFKTDEGSVCAKSLCFYHGWVPSAGVQLGVNYTVFGNWVYVLKIEGILSGGWSTRGFRLADPAPFIVLGQTGPILSFPVTFGIRYNF